MVRVIRGYPLTRPLQQKKREYTYIHPGRVAALFLLFLLSFHFYKKRKNTEHVASISLRNFFLKTPLSGVRYSKHAVREIHHLTFWGHVENATQRRL